MTIRYSKIIDSICTNYVTYYKYSKYESMSFKVGYNENGDIHYCSFVQKLISEEGEYYMKDEKECEPANLTKEQFESALNSLTDFLKRDQTESEK